MKISFAVADVSPNALGQDLIFEDTGGCISALKHIAPGQVWTEDDIRIRKESMLCKGREWLIVDNLVVHEDIKLGRAGADKYIRNYQQTLINLSRCGVKVVCYNFMPVLYKIRTHFQSSYPNRHVFSLFDCVAFTAFDLYILERSNAETSYSYYQRHVANCYYQRLTESEKNMLAENILSCTQSGNPLLLDDLKKALEQYRMVSNEQLYINFLAFKQEILPLAESLNLQMHFNSDNPCSNLLGLPGVF